MDYLFYLFAAITVVGAFLVVVNRSPIASAMSLIASFFGMAGLFVLMDAHFVAIMQILLYAGAIMVLFVFVIMLLNLTPNASRFKAIAGTRLILGGAGLYLGGLLMLIILGATKGQLSTDGAPAGLVGSVESVGELLLGQYIVPFEFTSVVLLIAVIGSVYLTKKKV